MHDTFPLLVKTAFPAIKRRRLETLQANLGYRCNQSCFHCHVAASPKRTEEMSWETMSVLLEFARRQAVQTLDLTGGAPEMNPNFRRLVSAARAQGFFCGLDEDRRAVQQECRDRSPSRTWRSLPRCRAIWKKTSMPSAVTAHSQPASRACANSMPWATARRVAAAS